MGVGWSGASAFKIGDEQLPLSHNVEAILLYQKSVTWFKVLKGDDDMPLKML